ncbi:MAG: hypothetical protein EPO61_10710 [Nitrospirae bacterium]|nr:MAG: hypothetical protein EPO61_10710 [Nitrospirota bacterium]
MATAESWLTVCAACQKVRSEDGRWEGRSQPFDKHEKALMTHTVCPDCTLRLYPELVAKVVRRCSEAFAPDKQAGEIEPR